VKYPVLLTVLLALGSAMPAAAQQLSEQDARKVVQNLVDTWEKAAQMKDAAGIAALYTEGTMRVTPDGILYGRVAVEKNFAEALKVFSNIKLKLDQVHVIDDGTIQSTGMWSGTVQTPNGPVPANGFWGVTDVKDSGTWKASLDVYNMATPPTPQEAKK
jgi:uncharacterized protein (TIGR02246 family)